MPNIGVAPPDYETNVGKFRLNTGDTTYTELDPPVVGQGDYVENSDAEIEAWLEQSGDSLYWALAWYYRAVARASIIAAKNIKDHDLSVSTEKRAEFLQKEADKWWAIAEAEDDELGLADIFEVSNIHMTKRYPEGMSAYLF